MAALCGLFYGSNKMATDVEVQFFSHLNGLTLGNNWGDLIRLLDKALVTGLDFTQITAASIDAQGDMHITLYAAHNAMLFQVVELSGFTPTSLNQKYRIKGVPNTTQLILKPALDITERSITAIGTGKLVSLGYEIIFRDTGDVKRVYRAKNPSAQHPFIRVDETISDGTNSYASTYAKYAMVGLLEYMAHIDDYQDTSKLQLPLDTTDFSKNWKITGTGTGVVRGWSRWYWARNHPSANPGSASGANDAASPANGNRTFTLCGDTNAFYLLANQTTVRTEWKVLYGTGLYNSCLKSDVIPNWFLLSRYETSDATVASSIYSNVVMGITPLMNGQNQSSFYTPYFSEESRIRNSVASYGLMPDYNSGLSGLYSNTGLSALEIPLYDANKLLKGSFKHAYYSGNYSSNYGSSTSPVLAQNSMYVHDRAFTGGSATDQAGGFYFYLGELE